MQLSYCQACRPHSFMGILAVLGVLVDLMVRLLLYNPKNLRHAVTPSVYDQREAESIVYRDRPHPCGS